MDQRHFDRVTAALGSGTGRRRAIAGLLAGAAAVFRQGTSATAKQRGRKKRRCTYCPQRACCSCAVDVQQSPTKCTLIETSASQTNIQDACLAFCEPGELFALNFQIPDLANFCATDFTCSVKSCPVRLKA